MGRLRIYSGEPACRAQPPTSRPKHSGRTSIIRYVCAKRNFSSFQVHTVTPFRYIPSTGACLSASEAYHQLTFENPPGEQINPASSSIHSPLLKVDMKSG